MNIGDLPQFIKSAYGNTNYNLNQVATGGWVPTTSTSIEAYQQGKLGQAGVVPPQATKPKGQSKPMSDLRIVRVYIADTNKYIPVDKRIIYSGAEQITNLDDQELFFEIDVKKLLDKHNEFRGTIRNKAESTKDTIVYLEPARIRDLKMIVVDIAKF